MKLETYLEELTEMNWHTLRELIELERNTLPIEKQMAVSNALECAIAYLEWVRYARQNGHTLEEMIERRIG